MNFSKFLFRFGIVFILAGIAAEPTNTSILEAGMILAIVGTILPLIELGSALVIRDTLEDDRDDRRYTKRISPISRSGRYVLKDRDRDVSDLNSSLKDLEDRLDDDYEIDRDEIRGGDS